MPPPPARPQHRGTPYAHPDDSASANGPPGPVRPPPPGGRDAERNDGSTGDVAAELPVNGAAHRLGSNGTTERGDATGRGGSATHRTGDQPAVPTARTHHASEQPTAGQGATPGAYRIGEHPVAGPAPRPAPGEQAPGPTAAFHHSPPAEAYPNDKHPPTPGPGAYRTGERPSAGAYRTGEHPVAGPAGATAASHQARERPTAGAYRTGDRPVAGPAGRPASGERRASADRHRNRLPRADRRQVVGVGLALVLVFAASLAIVNLTQGDEGTGAQTDAPVTTTPDPGSTAPDSAADPGAPGPEAPSTSPTTAAPPGAGSPAAGEPEPETPTRGEAGPVIASFGAVGQGLGAPCDATQRRITFAWESTGATSARLAGPGAPAGELPATGQTIACRDSGPPSTYTLTVTGPGGSTSGTASV